jgi:hypothetical protein
MHSAHPGISTINNVSGWYNRTTLCRISENTEGEGCHDKLTLSPSRKTPLNIMHQTGEDYEFCHVEKSRYCHSKRFQRGMGQTGYHLEMVDLDARGRFNNDLSIGDLGWIVRLA